MAAIAVIGTGNMGGALARAASKKLSRDELLLANRTRAKAEALAGEIGGTPVDSGEAAARGKYIFLGVKPQVMPHVLSDIAPVLARRADRFILVSMAAGLSIQRIRDMAGGAYPVIRIMPNTPAAIGAGMILYSPSEDVCPEEMDFFLDFMENAGRFSRLPEKLMDAGSSVSGCGPAFVDMFIEALADGGVACGLPRKNAMEYAAQMVMGSAKLILQSGRHPGELKDAVCSPGGTTIQGVRTLEEAGFRGAVIDAVIAAYEKNEDLK